MQRCISFVLLILVSSCSRYYEPPPQNLPLLDHKGEVQVCPALSIYGASVGMVGSPVQHLGINANAWKTFTKNKLTYGELGLGYYYGFHNHFNFEAYAGWGHGASGMNDSITPLLGKTSFYSGDGSFNNYYLQWNCGYDIKSTVLIAVGVRYVTINYQANRIQRDAKILHNVYFLGEGFEISGAVRAGHNHVFGEFGGTLSLIKMYNSNGIFKVSPLQIFMGLVLKF